MKKSTKSKISTKGIKGKFYRLFTFNTSNTSNTFTTFRKGFTLPELLIVMTVLAGLAAIMMVSYPASQKRARDTRRISDIKQYQTAIELYANRNNSYAGISGSSPTSACSTLGLSNCPADPKNTAPYVYGMSVNATAYALWTRLELDKPPLTTTYFIVCSNGKSGYCSNTVSADCSGSCP